jgi:hypothetical protein
MMIRSAVRQLEKDVKEHDTSHLELLLESGALSQLRPKEAGYLWVTSWKKWHQYQGHERLILGTLMGQLQASFPFLCLPEWAKQGINQEALE